VLSGRLPRRALLITFDDGFRSVVDVALPVLERLGLPSVFFVSAAYLDPATIPLDNLLCALAARGELAAASAAIGVGRADTVADVLAHVRTLPYARRAVLGDELAERHGLDRAALRAGSGLFLDRHELAALPARRCEIGNHTRSHVFCRAIADADAAEAELVSHRRQLEAWAGSPVRSFSYPYGSREDATPFVERMLADSGHAASFLVEARPNRPGAGQRPWNRVSLDGRPAWRVRPELEVLPRLRGARDRLRHAGAA
jgi:peptidoglycan/xylan/chitin deacetylase (PgdA/CDA1 family)